MMPERQGSLFETDDGLKPWQGGAPHFDGPGQARRSDPDTAKLAAQFIRARAGTARVRLMEAHAKYPAGLSDEDAARDAGLRLSSEYATRCSELVRLGFLKDTTNRAPGRAGTPRIVRQITPLGRAALAAREEAAR